MTEITRRKVIVGGMAALSAPFDASSVSQSLAAPVAALPGEWWWAGPKYGVLNEGPASRFLTLRRVGARPERTLSGWKVGEELWRQCAPGSRLRFEGSPRDILEFQPKDHPEAVAGRLAADQLALARSAWGLFWKGRQHRDGSFNAFHVGSDHWHLAYPRYPSVHLLSGGHDYSVWKVRYGWSWHGPLIVEAHSASNDEVEGMLEPIDGWKQYLRERGVSSRQSQAL